MTRALGKDTITLTMPGEKTVHGSKVDDWANPAPPVTVKGCYVELMLTDEQLAHRDATLAAGTVFAPAGTFVDPRMKVTYDGKDYAVDGQALEAHSYSGSIDYVPIPIKRWEGS